MQFRRILCVYVSRVMVKMYGVVCVTCDVNLLNLDGVSVNRCLFYIYKVSDTFSRFL